MLTKTINILSASNRTSTSNRSILPVVLVAFWVGLSAVTNSAERPNMILFIADDVSWNDYGCYGNRFARTPNIDSLARNGLKFTNAFLTASSCSPSRASIITGRYPHNNGKAAELHLPIAPHLPWFPEILRKNGYYTALVGKNHMTRGPDPDGKTRPAKAFDLIDNGQVKDNHGAESKWVQTVRDRPRDKPFFFWFAAIDAHRGWDGDREWKEEYGPRHDPARVTVPPYLIDNLATRQDLASYYNEVTRFDYYIGKVVRELERQKILDNTLILVMADNGRPFPRAKTRVHDSGMKTALVAHWPERIERPTAPAGPRQTNALVSAIDIAPTFLDAAGIKPAETMQGTSMAPLFSNPGKQIRKYAFSEHNWHDYEAHGRAVRNQQGYLYIVNHRPYLAWQGPADSVRSPSHQSILQAARAGKLTPAQQDVIQAPRPQVELYDTRSDPLQLKNLAGTQSVQRVESELRNIMEQWVQETGDSVPEKISADSFDRKTGKRLAIKQYRFTTPGEDRGASRINKPGPR